MRRILQEDQTEPLAPDEVKRFIEIHLPYRLELIRDAVPRVPARCLADDQAFEAAAVAGRVMLNFLGVGYDSKKETLREDRTHQAKEGLTDDVKVVDVGGRYVDLGSLSPEETVVLTRFIHGVHKACAHLTTGSQHGLDPATFQSAAPLIRRLYEEQMKRT